MEWALIVISNKWRKIKSCYIMLLISLLIANLLISHVDEIQTLALSGLEERRLFDG